MKKQWLLNCMATLKMYKCTSNIINTQGIFSSEITMVEGNEAPVLSALDKKIVKQIEVIFLLGIYWVDGLIWNVVK